MPQDNCGNVKIVLSEASARALDHVEDLETWSVQPTMIRGAKNVVPSDVEPLTKFAGKRPKKASGKVDKINKKVKAAGAPKEPSPSDDYRRNAKGRDAIMQRVQDFINMDTRIFAGNPTFYTDGKCRINYDGASNFSTAEIVAAAPQCLECVFLVRHGFQSMDLSILIHTYSYIFILIRIYIDLCGHVHKYPSTSIHTYPYVSYVWAYVRVCLYCMCLYNCI